MKKLWFSSVLALIFLSVACKQRTAAEMDQGTGDTTAMRVDTSFTQPDRTNVEPDSIPSAGEVDVRHEVGTAGDGDAGGESKAPGAKPKPGKMSRTDSIKASYPPKK